MPEKDRVQSPDAIGDKPQPTYRGDQHHDHQHLFADAVHGFLSCPGDTLVIRANTGISGDIMVAGLMALVSLDQDDLNLFMTKLNLGHLAGKVALEARSVNEVRGHGLKVDLPPEHVHRNLADIHEFFQKCDISPTAREFAMRTFRIIAEVEALVHNVPVNEVHFHEVGALDSIIDIGLTAVILSKMPLKQIWCSPLPVCDGSIQCAHGKLPSPAPAVMHLMEGIPVYGLDSEGETVTPTGLALLRAMNARFGPWPPVVIEKQALVFGGKVFKNVPNGTVFILGQGMDPVHADPVASLARIR